MISLLAAMDKNRVIGFDQDMPWHLPRDLQFFKEKTTGNTMIMGRKTFESIGRPLPNRKTIVLTRQNDFDVEGVEVISHIDEIFKWVENNPEEELFIVGGGELYKQMLPYADRMYITEIDESFSGDTYFPSFDKDEWELTEKNKGIKDERNVYDYYFLQYDRIGSK